jgi:hypothetical protein
MLDPATLLATPEAVGVDASPERAPAEAVRLRAHISRRQVAFGPPSTQERGAATAARRSTPRGTDTPHEDRGILERRSRGDENVARANLDPEDTRG